MDRHDDERSGTGFPEVVMASSDMAQNESLTLKSRENLFTADLGKARQPTATSRSTNSTGPGMEIPTFSAASR